MSLILVIEDEEDIRETLGDILSVDNHDVIYAADGREGIRQARQHLPDLIISDIMMPEMDGYDVFRELKQDISTANIPFIFLSALSNYDHVRKGMNIGADDYLTKPFDYQQVSSAVSSRLQRHIERENLRLRELSARLIQMQERNYKQIANMLTNVIGEPLKGLNLLLSLTSDLDTNIIKEIHQVVDGLVEHVGSISLQLHPTMLEHLGMLSIVRWLSEMYHERYKLRVTFLHAGLHEGISPTTKIIVYRILEEALLNVVQHSRVEEVEVKLRLKQELIELDIIDSGIGFDVEHILSKAQTTGLPTMMARIQYFNGEINIRSIPDIGTHIHVQLPLALEKNKVQHPLPELSTLPVNRDAPPKNRHAILLVEDHDIIRQGIRRLLEQNQSVVIMGEVTNGHDIFPFLHKHPPDLIFLDMSIPGLTGMEIMRVIKQQFPQIKILALSPYKEEIYAREALKNGASGYILTESPSIEILKALDAVLAGQQFVTSMLTLDPENTQEFVHEISEDWLETADLTSRELEILLLVAEGLTSGEIGNRLSISRRTVEKHRSNFMKKLGVKNHMQLLTYVVNKQL